MDLYPVIHKLYQSGGGGGVDADASGSGGTSENKSLWDSHYQDRGELARFLNMMLAAKCKRFTIE